MVTDTAHGAVEGDFVTYSGAASLGGNVVAAVLNQEYQIDLIVNANSYNITAKRHIRGYSHSQLKRHRQWRWLYGEAYQINTGTNFYVDSTGWGVGGWGVSAFGESGRDYVIKSATPI